MPAPGSVVTPTIEEVYWYHSEHRPATVSIRLDDPETAGHLLMVLREEDRHVRGGYTEFWKAAGKRFALRAPDVPEVPARVTRGYWTGARTLYPRIEPQDLRGMRPGVSYRLEAVGDTDDRPTWRVADEVRVMLRAG